MLRYSLCVTIVKKCHDIYNTSRYSRCVTIFTIYPDIHDVSVYHNIHYISLYARYITIFMIYHDIHNTRDISQYPQYITILTIYHNIYDISRYPWCTRYIMIFAIYHDIHEAHDIQRPLFQYSVPCPPLVNRLSTGLIPAKTGQGARSRVWLQPRQFHFYWNCMPRGQHDTSRYITDIRDKLRYLRYITTFTIYHNIHDISRYSQYTQCIPISRFLMIFTIYRKTHVV